MARILNQGVMATVELKSTDEGQVRGTCIEHRNSAGLVMYGVCTWSDIYDDWNDATEYSTDHADRGV